MLTTLLACHGTVEQAAAPMLAGGSWEEIFRWPGPLFIIGGAIAIVAIAGGTITSIVKTKAREQTRREIAAYVAEGTIDADKAVEMLKAEPEDD